MVVNPATICIETAPQSSDTLIQIPQKASSQVTLQGLMAQSNGVVSLPTTQGSDQNKGMIKNISPQADF